VGGGLDSAGKTPESIRRGKPSLWRFGATGCGSGGQTRQRRGQKGRRGGRGTKRGDWSEESKQKHTHAERMQPSESAYNPEAA